MSSLVSEPKPPHSEPRQGTRATLLALGATTLASVSLEPLAEIVTLPSLWFWIVVMAVALALPFIVQRKRRLFDPFTPLTYPVWSYLAPVFVVGSIVLAGGIAQQAPRLIPIPVERYFCLAMAYLVVGWVGLLVGYYSRWGELIGTRVSRWLPKTGWKVAELRVSAVLLLAGGLGLYWLAFRVGVVGVQRLETVGPYDGLLIFLSYVSHIAAFLLWFSLFKRPVWSGGEWALAAALYLLGPLHLAISGSRAGLIAPLLVLALAFGLAGRRVRWPHLVLFGVLGATSLAIGTAWSTTYRLQKGSEAPIYNKQEAPPEEPADTAATPKASDEVPDEVFPDEVAATSLEVADEVPVTSPEAPKTSNIALLADTAQILGEDGLRDTLLFALRTVALRIEITSSVAMLVANYQRLRPLEEEHGLAGNIWRDTWTSPIPRFLWPGKPQVSDVRTYSLLYFRSGENSMAMTPVGDLLRNFGPVGIPLGMALLGFALRILYHALREGRATQPAQAAIYAILLMNISYEGSFGLILPTVMRLLVVAGGALLAVHLGVTVQRWIQRPERP